MVFPDHWLGVGFVAERGDFAVPAARYMLIASPGSGAPVQGRRGPIRQGHLAPTMFTGSLSALLLTFPLSILP